MSYFLPTEAQTAAFRDHSQSGPIWMLNLLRFKEDGQESYQRYVEAVKPLIEKRGGRILRRSRGHGTLVGPDEENWDEMLLVMYPAREALLDMVESDEYGEIVHFRQDALVDSRLYLTTELPIP